MKLRQRIFLVSLAVVLIATGSTAAVVLSGYFSSTLTREEQNAVRLHCYLGSAMEGSVLWQRISDGLPRLPADRVEEVLQSQLRGQDGFLRAYYRRENELTGEELPLVDAAKEKDGCATVLRKSGDCMELTVCSGLSLEGEEFLLFSVTDVTETYRQYRAQANRGLLLALLFAVGIALLMLVLVRLLLRPLSNIREAIGFIAGGDYARRLDETGSPEFKELSEGVNRMAAAIEEQTTRLQETAESRKRFADSMAHEMKTPLTSILCMADLLRIKREVSEDERLEYAGVIVDEAKRMKELSSKLLTLASADGTALDLRPISIAALAEELAATFAPILEKKGMKLLTAGEDGVFYADESLFKTLLFNLIDNAAKASSAGQQIGLYHTRRGNRLQIAVADEGRGMDAEALRHATEPFYMANKSRSRKEGGAGLGLFLCAEVAKLHGADLHIESTPGKGTTVTLTVPLAPESEVPQ